MTDQTPQPGHPAPRPANKTPRVVLEWAAVACLSIVLVVGLALSGVASRADNLIYDALARASVHKPSDDIVIIGIDNRSIAAIGRWPWPRARHAELLNRLGGMKPRAVAYDVLFLEPDRQGGDGLLAAALRSAAPVYLPMTFDVPGSDGAPFDVMEPISPLLQAAAGVGQSNVAFDEDGIVRRTFLTESDAQRSWPHLMQHMANASAKAAPSQRAGSFLPSPSPRAPIEGLLRADPVMVAFAGPAGTYRTISAIDLLRGETPPEFIRNKLVLVGATADGLGDQYSTPLSFGGAAMPGVELQANLLGTLIDGRAVKPLPTAAVIPLSLVLLAVLLVAFLRLSPRANMVLGGALIALSLAIPAVLFLHWRIWAPPTAAVAGLLAAYPLWSWRRLEASSAYMMDELKRFAADRDLWSTLSARSDSQSGDRIARQVSLLHDAIGRARDARSFVTDTLQGLPDPVLVVGLDGRIAFANRAAETLFHPSPLIGADPAALAGDGAPEILPTAGLPDQLTSPGGQVFNVLETPLTNADGRQAGRIIRFTDITALKNASDERERVMQFLTHDMRSPQVSILSLLGRGKAASNLPDVADRIAGYARRTLALADNFVHLARAEQSALQLEPVDLGQMLLDAVDDLWAQSSAKAIAITTEGDNQEHLILADRSLLTRALINLIDNAVKFTKPGGSVTCRLARDLSCDPAAIVCTISDTGCGMPPSELERIFARFARAARGHSSAGVGLGLSFVETVISRHHGDISCVSEVEVGTTFTLRFSSLDQDAQA